MGNGAPDLSANISAIRSGQVSLSAGAFTGAAMFVQCVVASEVRAVTSQGGGSIDGCSLMLAFDRLLSTISLGMLSEMVTRAARTGSVT